MGFEVESSWRTRKHIKGDLLNLMDLQPALGIIVLAGAGPKVEATKRFARLMVQRRVCRIEIWDETEVSALAKGGSRAAKRLVDDLPVEAAAPTDVGASGRTKYAALSAWLVGEKRQTIEASFREIEEVLGSPFHRPLDVMRPTGMATRGALSLAPSKKPAGMPETSIYPASGSCSKETTVLGRPIHCRPARRVPTKQGD